MRKQQTRKGSGFTLIELLIVVAIIAILAAIAVPNFLEAQTRSKVARIKADFRTVATALTAYYVDNNTYPWKLHILTGNNNRGDLVGFPGLSTPIAYIASTDIKDPFVPPIEGQFEDANNPGTASAMVGSGVLYVNVDKAREENKWSKTPTKWALVSYGPDLGRGPFPPSLPFSVAWVGNYRGTVDKDPKDLDNYFATATYDPTNGTKSGGDIIRWSVGQVN